MLPGCSGLTPMPRKMSGSAMSRIEELIIATSIPSVVFESATHLYSSFTEPSTSWQISSTIDVNVNFSSRIPGLFSNGGAR